MALHIHPAAFGLRRLLLQDEGDGVLLRVRQRIVAAEALGDVNALPLGIAANLQHVAVEIAVDVAVFIAGLVGDQEAVVGIVLLVVDVFPIQDLKRGGGHFEVIDGILADRQAVLRLVQGDIHVALFVRREYDGLAFFRPRLVDHRPHVGIEQAERGAFKAPLHVPVGIGEQLNAVHPARAGDIRAGGGDGDLIFDCRGGAAGIIPVRDPAERRGVGNIHLIPHAALDTGGIGNGCGLPVGYGKRSGIAAVIKRRVLTLVGLSITYNANRSIVDGLVIAERILDGDVSAIIQRQRIRIEDDLIARQVAVESREFFRDEIGDLALCDDQQAVLRRGDHIVAGGVLRLLQRYAFKGDVVHARISAAAGGLDAFVKSKAIHVAGIATDGDFLACLALRVAVGFQGNGGGVDGGGDALGGLIVVHPVRHGIGSRVLCGGNHAELIRAAIKAEIQHIRVVRRHQRVFLAVIGGFHRRHRGAGDFQLAVDIGNFIVGSHVIARGIHDLRRAGYVVAAANIRLSAGHGHGFDAVAIGQGSVGIAVLGQRRAVVDLRGAVGGDGQGLSRHFEGTVGVGEAIAGRHVLARGVHDFCPVGHVVAAADQRLAAGHGHGLDAVARAQLGVGIAVLLQRRTVIHLRVAVGGDGQGLLRHFERAVNIGNFIARGHVLAVGVHDLRRGGNVTAAPDHCLAAGHGHGLDAVARGQVSVGIAVLLQRRAVVHLRIAGGGDGQGGGFNFAARHLNDNNTVIVHRHGQVYRRCNHIGAGNKPFAFCFGNGKDRRIA